MRQLWVVRLRSARTEAGDLFGPDGRVGKAIGLVINVLAFGCQGSAHMAYGRSRDRFVSKNSTSVYGVQMQNDLRLYQIP